MRLLNIGEILKLKIEWKSRLMYGQFFMMDGTMISTVFDNKIKLAVL